MRKPSIAVVIPAHNAAGTLERQLRALDMQSRLDFDVLVVSNRSTDNIQSVVRWWKPRFQSLRLEHADEATGAAYARNSGVALIDAELVLFCDADDAVHVEWVESHASLLEDAHVSTGPLVLRNSRISSGPIWNPRAAPVAMGHSSYAPSCNMGIRRETFLKMGGFDERMKLGHEDVDLGWRLVADGFQITHSSRASIDYFQREGLWHVARQQYTYGMAFADLFNKYQPEDVSVQSLKWRTRWWVEYIRANRLLSLDPRRTVPLLAFQFGRVQRSKALAVDSPMW